MKIEFKIRRYARARHMRLHIHEDGTVTVSVPKFVAKRDIQAFIETHNEWINNKLISLQNREGDLYKFDDDHFLQNKEEALRIVNSHIEELNGIYKFKINRIRINRPKTRWGSCSSSGNLNFHYKIVFLPIHLQRYLIAHELCHLQYMNHSPSFWNLVSKTISNYKECRRELKNIMH